MVVSRHPESTRCDGHVYRSRQKNIERGMGSRRGGSRASPDVCAGQDVTLSRE